MRVLVTGATGFIGRHLVAQLAARDHEVISTGRGTQGPREAVRHVPHDIGNPAPFPEVGRLDAIVHLAGRSSVQDAIDDPMGVAQTNAQGTLHALLLVRKHGAHFILASSQLTYQRGPRPRTERSPQLPSDLYGYTKLIAERYLEMAGRLFGVTGAILRFFSVYGPGQLVTRGTSGVVSIFAQRALAGEPIRILSHERRDFVAVDDAVEAIIAALSAARCPPSAYNIGTGVGTSIDDLARRICAITGSASPILEGSSSQHPGDLVANITRARRELGYAPGITLNEGLQAYVDWLRSI
jgi:UDP-glucose 4-epimerase